MNNFELIMPKLGESIEEATITKWFVKPGDKVNDDDILLEIATDKVDSEIPSPVTGTVVKILFNQDEIVKVGTVIALIDTNGTDLQAESEKPGSDVNAGTSPGKPGIQADSRDLTDQPVMETETAQKVDQGRFYSPLVRKIAHEENISMDELNSIKGSGHDGRVQKNDVLDYLAQRKQDAGQSGEVQEPVAKNVISVDQPAKESFKVSVSLSAGDEIIQMDRMRKLIAEHMVRSKQISPHVTNMLEADVTDLVLWRNRIKDDFYQKEKEKITYLPLFLEAVIHTIKDYPMINASVDGDKIIIRKNINLGIAVALPTGNLIVPVIKNADQMNLLGLTKSLNKLAEAARNNKLSPDDIQGGTFTISNFGTFGNVMGTPIINQPQVAVLAIGTIEKKPAVIETPAGDLIGIRHKMFLSLTYDHRIIDGAYGGAFLRKLADFIEDFDSNRTI
ncbi:MAG: diapophytoene dehydrogenase [Bacteroides sp. SM23_62_1]|nr:MAG: diapophytoene dehydrogenase [Bacteroides sp. SM23_62_1]